MESDNERPHLIKVKITHLIKFASSFKGVEVHVFVDQKYVKMNYSTDQFVDILRRLQQRDLEEVYINDVDCTRVLEEIKASMSSKSFYNPKTTDEERIQVAERSFEIIKNFIKEIGINKQSVDILNSVNQKTLAILSESPSIFMFIKRFKTSCSEEFLKSVLTSYLAIRLIEQFAWSSLPVKEKASLASLLCDITLEKEDFKELKEYELSGGALSEKLKNHPFEVTKILALKKDIVPSETLTIIEQHHEKPDGSGFPFGIQLNRFNQLSSIFIIAQKFIEHLVHEDFDYSKRQQIIEKLQKSYNGKTFDKALSALIAVVY